MGRHRKPSASVRPGLMAAAAGGIAQVRDHVVADRLAQRVGVPHRVVDQPLHPVRGHMPGPLRQRPAVLLRQLSASSPPMNCANTTRGSGRLNKNPDEPASTDSSASRAAICSAVIPSIMPGQRRSAGPVTRSPAVVLDPVRLGHLAESKQHKESAAAQIQQVRCGPGRLGSCSARPRRPAVVSLACTAGIAVGKPRESQGKGGQNSPAHGWCRWCKTSGVISRLVEASGHLDSAVALIPRLVSRCCTRLIRP